jgi:hypothetical protein
MITRGMLIAIVGAALFLGWGFYCVGWSPKVAESYNHDGQRQVSERQIRFMGWVSFVMGLGPLYGAVTRIIEALR